jgi:hypothetical protein
MRRIAGCVLLSGLAWLAAAAPGQIRAGAAKASITPRVSMWLAGSPARTHASEPSSADELAIRALALDDGAGGRALIFSIDLYGMPRSLTDAAAVSIMAAHGLERSQILFNFTHTHNAPLIRGLMPVREPSDRREQRRLEAYAASLPKYLTDLAGAALANMQPVSAAFGAAPLALATSTRGEARTADRVPVLRLTTPQGAIFAVLFGYACDNASLPPSSYGYSGDYAALAETTLEHEFKGSIAAFLQLCGADQIPRERGAEDAVTANGVKLAEQVSHLLKTPMSPVSGRLHTALIETALPFAPVSRQDYEAAANDGDPVKSAWAKRQLEALAQRASLRQLPYPVQVIRFDKGFSLVALAGAPAYDYTALVNDAVPKGVSMVAGFSNELSCYVPTARQIDHNDDMAAAVIDFGLPAPLTAEAEARIVDAVKRAWQRASAK